MLAFMKNNYWIFKENTIRTLERMESESVDLIIIDPPYGIDYQSNHRKNKLPRIRCDKGEHFKRTMRRVYRELYRVLKNGGALYSFCNDVSEADFRRWIGKHFKIKNSLLWVKNGRTGGDIYGAYAKQTERILFAHKGRHILNDGRDTDVLHCNRVASRWHPTPKPPALIAKLILKSSKPGDVVFDGFMGSGATAFAAIMTGRRFLGAEMDDRNFTHLMNDLAARLNLRDTLAIRAQMGRRRNDKGRSIVAI